MYKNIIKFLTAIFMISGLFAFITPNLINAQQNEKDFVSLFNGKDLSQWTGNKTDYLVENGNIAVRPKNGGHGNLYTKNEYSDFIFRFEFKLTREPITDSEFTLLWREMQPMLGKKFRSWIIRLKNIKI